MTSHLSGPSILFAIGVGVANVCVGVAHATDFPQVRYEVTGSSPRRRVHHLPNRHRSAAQVNATLPWSTQFTGFRRARCT